MVKKTGSESKANLADRLIQEALKAVEKEEAQDPASKGELEDITVTSVDDDEHEPQPEIKIDLKQYVEREAYLRLLAEFENFRKRALKDREISELAGKERILLGFLDVLDNFERGISQAADDSSALATGMRMVLSQADHWLTSEGLIRIETSGKKFDPQCHEAISQIEDDFVEAGMIVEEMRRGYRWRDKLLRPAAVVVSRGPKER
jgi:molecular chaperone GrpE